MTAATSRCMAIVGRISAYISFSDKRFFPNNVQSNALAWCMIFLGNKNIVILQQVWQGVWSQSLPWSYLTGGFWQEPWALFAMLALHHFLKCAPALLVGKGGACGGCRIYFPLQKTSRALWEFRAHGVCDCDV